MEWVLLHNPRCSKSRQAKQLLEDRGIDYVVREYLKEPLSLDELRILKKKLGSEPATWLRWGEAEAEGLDKEAPPLELLGAMAAHPVLIERPILIGTDSAAVGRPTPEAILSLFDA